MDFDICIRLARLHDDLQPQPFPQALRLSVGVAATAAAGEWLPPDYPFTPGETAAILQELRGMSLTDLEILRLHLGRDNLGAHLREQQERNDLAQFSGQERGEDPWDALRRHAHKMLIWLWHMEEQWAEIAAIEARCLAAEAALPHNFSEFDYAPLPENRSLPVEPSDRLWRSTLMHAALFIPLHIPILAEGQLREELLETQELKPLSCCVPLSGIYASLGQVLGNPGFQPPSVVEEAVTLYNGNRLWLVQP